jgi:hypothetical protein
VQFVLYHHLIEIPLHCWTVVPGVRTNAPSLLLHHIVEAVIIAHMYRACCIAL